MITICGCGGRKPLNTPQLWREGLTQARRLENSTGWFLPRKEYSRKSWSPGRRLRLPQPQRPGAPTCEAAARGARRTAKGPLGLPGGTGLRASLQSRRNWGNSSKLGSTPPPEPYHERGQGPDQQSHSRRATAAQGLQPQSPRSGERLTWEAARESCAFFSTRSPAPGRLPTPFPQPAGGAARQQREPVSPFITSRLRRLRWGGGDCNPRYVSSITPAARRLRRRPARALRPYPWPTPTPRTPHQPVESEAERRDRRAGLGCNAPARGSHHATVSMVTWDLRCFFQQVA